ncbi:MAG: FAD-binding oxidoreductase [Anaerolineales bacterium]|nr:FAD-binding oxidoreductase [Anaerolineales bacterium]MCL4260793.1 FAD-dependent oxidoreductase [Anaerolineales bacterium]
MNADILICGAGMAGAAIAYQLAVKHNVKNIVIVDPLPPLTLTSDKSTECYRNWWPGPGDAMVGLMNRSIDLMDTLHNESPARLPMHRYGYLFATADPERAKSMTASAEEISRLGAGELRIHRGASNDSAYTPVTQHGLADAPTGADLFLDQSLIRKYFPHLTERTVALLHARRCGWFAAQQFGMYMLEKGLECGVQLIKGKVESVEVEGNRIKSVKVGMNGGEQTISTQNFVIAAGPMQKQVGRMIGIDIPIHNELHLKTIFNDSRHVFPREMGLLIWNDPVALSWSDDEREALAESDETKWLTSELPSGVHGRPEGEGDMILLQWVYHNAEAVEPTFPVPLDPQLPEVALRGMAAVIPGLSTYFNQIPKPFIDGGYYARTKENRALIGPLAVEGAYIIGGLGGFGMMSSCGASDLLAKHIVGAELPSYAPAFLLSRYDNPQYQETLKQWGASGEL